MSANGRIERITSSKNKVKSKPPRQAGPAHAENVSSTEGQPNAEFDAMVLDVISPQRLWVSLDTLDGLRRVPWFGDRHSTDSR